MSYTTYILFEPYVPGRGEGKQFYTKTFGMDVIRSYVVDKKGYLCLEHYDYKFVQDEDHVLGGYLEKIPYTYRREYLTNYNGDIIFYENLNAEDQWTARFAEGKLKEITFKTRERLNDEEILHEHPTVWEQNTSQGSK